jgi:uncharacterized protein (DUF1697 family)
MPRYIAFLRAINVGGHTVKMDRLRGLFEAISLSNVETFIASGNVIFESRASAAKLESRIATHLLGELGYEVATFLRTPAELAKVAERDAFSGKSSIKKPVADMVAFLHQPPKAAAKSALMALRAAQDDFAVVGREVHWWCRTKISESRFSNAALEKALGAPATFRSITTIRKLAAKYPV